MQLVTDRVLGVALDQPAMDLYLRAVRAGCPLGVTSSFRDPERQARFFHENYIRDYSLSARYDAKDWGGVWYWRRHYNARTGGTTVSVAVPGTSKHEKGRALDLPASPRAWMHEHGRPFGIINPAWAKQSGTFEPWHFEVYPHLATITKEDPMPTPEEIASAVHDHRIPLSDTDRQRLGISWSDATMGDLLRMAAGGVAVTREAVIDSVAQSRKAKEISARTYDLISAGGEYTAAAVEAAVETAIRDVLGSLND